ncbi:hypothetical protein [Actinophytocola sp.]|uniref:hypothetical protein n=1 Tax=Actinophytocola sp. TaxID=1872138 RepID=UPI002D7E722D|nr:hypothetical protein [Actinophytocola sp.]HET9138892.1 hypothetical protein [Actinophytocola sp.]
MNRADRWWKRTGLAAAVACGVCCAVPLIALLGGIGVAGSLAAVVGVVEVVSIALSVVAFGGAGVLWLRRRRRRACRVPDRTAELTRPV